MFLPVIQEDDSDILSDNSISFVWHEKHLLVATQHQKSTLTCPRQPLNVWPAAPSQSD